MNLADSLRTIRLGNARPLVSSEDTLLPSRVDPPPRELPQWQLLAIGIGAGLALLFWLLQGYQAKTANMLMLLFWALAGTFGSVMILLWLFTDHRFAFANENLLLLSPLAWLAALLYFLRHTPRGRKAYALAVKAVALMAVLAAMIKLLGFSAQNNMNWLLLLLPLHALICRHALADLEQKTAT